MAFSGLFTVRFQVRKTGSEAKHRLNKQTLFTINECVNESGPEAWQIQGLNVTGLQRGGPVGSVCPGFWLMGSAVAWGDHVAMGSQTHMRETPIFLPQLLMLAKAICPVPWGFL